MKLDLRRCGRLGDCVHCEELLDEYRSAVEARVRWEQQADAEGYNIGPNIPGGPA